MIIGYFGLPGAGKTYKMSMDSIAAMKRGYNVYSNYPVKGAYKLTFQVLVQLPSFKKPTLLLLDEVQQFANSRQWKSLDPNLYFIFSQGRKMGLDLFYSAQDSSRVDKTLREVTNFFYDIQTVPLIPSLRQVDIYTTNANYSLKTRRYSKTFYYVKSSGIQFKQFDFEKWSF